MLVLTSVADSESLFRLGQLPAFVATDRSKPKHGSHFFTVGARREGIVAKCWQISAQDAVLNTFKLCRVHV